LEASLGVAFKKSKVSAGSVIKPVDKVSISGKSQVTSAQSQVACVIYREKVAVDAGIVGSLATG